MGFHAAAPSDMKIIVSAFLWYANDDRLLGERDAARRHYQWGIFGSGLVVASEASCIETRQDPRRQHVPPVSHGCLIAAEYHHCRLFCLFPLLMRDGKLRYS